LVLDVTVGSADAADVVPSAIVFDPSDGSTALLDHLPDVARTH
jgi:hypothetical protein